MMPREVEQGGQCTIGHFTCVRQHDGQYGVGTRSSLGMLCSTLTRDILPRPLPSVGIVSGQASGQTRRQLLVEITQIMLEQSVIDY